MDLRPDHPLTVDQWQTMFNAMRDGVVLIDLDHRVVYCNDQFRSLMGRPRDTIIGVQCCQLLHGSVCPPPECPLLHATPEHKRESWRTPVGDRWFSVIADPVHDAHGQLTGFVHVMTDITEHQRAEAAQQESDARLKKVLETETVGVMFWDLTTGTLVDANDTFLGMMGYSRAEVEAHAITWQTLTPPEYVDISLAEVEKFHRTGRVGPYEKEYLRKDGSRLWLVFAGSALGPESCVEFCVDISARKRAEAALRESEQALRTANARLQRYVDANIMGVIIAGPQGQVLDANDYYLNLLGVSREEFEQGRVNWRSITPPEWLPSDEKAIAELREHGVCTPYEKEYLRPDGTRVAVYLADAMLPGSSEQIVAFVLDITDRKTAEARVAASLQEKEVLLREIHHRVKNNLQIISSLLQLQSNEVQDARVLEKLRESQSRIHSMALIHERLYQSQNFARIAMEGYVRDLAASLFRSYNASGISLSLHVADLSLPLDRAIPCGLILNELMTNALKYGVQGRGQGAVEVALGNDGDGMIVMTVRDNGPGFAPGLDMRNTKSLGLLLVRMLTEQIGGRVDFSHEGGAMISVTFPSAS